MAGAVTVAQVIDDLDTVTARAQLLDRVRTDETGSAGDENFFPARFGGRQGSFVSGV